MNTTELEAVFDELWPLNRSLSGEGNRRSFAILNHYMPFNIREIPSGTTCFDWTIPPEWNVNEAWISETIIYIFWAILRRFMKRCRLKCCANTYILCPIFLMQYLIGRPIIQGDGAFVCHKISSTSSTKTPSMRYSLTAV